MTPNLARPSSFRTFRGGAAWPPPSRCRLERSAIGSLPVPPAAPLHQVTRLRSAAGAVPMETSYPPWPSRGRPSCTHSKRGAIVEYWCASVMIWLFAPSQSSLLSNCATPLMFIVAFIPEPQMMIATSAHISRSPRQRAHLSLDDNIGHALAVTARRAVRRGLSSRAPLARDARAPSTGKTLHNPTHLQRAAGTTPPIIMIADQCPATLKFFIPKR
jgi:hypothetical protein